ncbi:hypothetical protein LCGC14_0820170 [marine sediment metagenome]|uniref:Uncharacterized protein n=1 Tax=marine sediment metagenome TaxID=412755 RepID=A0A0F9Q4G8_9ZZZZ
MFIELTQLKPRRKVTISTTSIKGLKKSKKGRGSMIQRDDNSLMEVFEFYRVVQFLMYKSRRKAVASFSPNRDKKEWLEWCIEYMGDKRGQWQEQYDDCNYTSPQDIDDREAMSVDDQGIVTFDDGTKGWIYDYTVIDLETNERTRIQGINHVPRIKISEAGDPISDSLPPESSSILDI